MADLSDVYGQNYEDESRQSRLDYIINNLANNISHRQFKFRLHDNNELWDSSQNLKKKVIDSLINKVKNINKKLHVNHIDKNSEKINMLPELIVDTPIEYFYIIDAELGRAYFIYITPTEVNSY
jgi:hypothetical protein